MTNAVKDRRLGGQSGADPDVELRIRNVEDACREQVSDRSYKVAV
jgi:hypothetical protein